MAVTRLRVIRVLQVDRVLVEEGRRDEVADHARGEGRAEDRQRPCAVEHRLRVPAVGAVVAPRHSDRTCSRP